MGDDQLKRIKDYIIICLIIITSILIFTFKKDVTKIGGYGYISIFVLCLLSNLTVFLPAPSLMIVVAYSQVLSPVLVAIIGAVGTTMGEMSGYLLGGTIDNISTKWNKLINWISKRIKNVYLLVFVFALMPLPLFDFAGIYAGSRRVSLSLFFMACYVGKLIKMLFYIVMVGHIIAKYI